MKAGCPRRIIAPSRISAASASPSIGVDPLDDRVAADLLLAVEGEADVDRELTRGGELPHGLDEHEHVPLVVGDPAREEAPSRCVSSNGGDSQSSSGSGGCTSKCA